MGEVIKEPQSQEKPEKQKRSPLQTLFDVLGVVLCVVFIPIIILNVIMIVRSYTDSDHIPSVFGYAPVIVLSGSMSPTFEVGDMIIIQKTDPATLKVNDVICYLEEESAVTHRIMEIQQVDGQPVFITQGDANNAEDIAPVNPDQVQGKYAGVRLAGVGDFAMFLQSLPGMLIFIGGPIVLFLLWDVGRRVLENRRRKGEKSKQDEERQAMEQELERLRAQMNASQNSRPSDPQTGGPNEGSPPQQ